jgi:RNA polymerase sigma-70 factor (ECF subfamily)
MGDLDQLLLRGKYSEEQLAQQLFESYYAPLHYLAFSLLDDSEAAADIVQETLLIALEKINDYRPGTDLKAWLCRIAIYRCRSAMRRRKARQKWYAIWSRVAALGTPKRTPERVAADHELKGELWQAVDNLSDKHRLPVILFYVHGLSAPEIAKILDIREGTVYSRLHYACRKLAGQFANSELEKWAKELFNE